jgi:DNA (cytosine-5)-methyltransferase 1
MFCGAGGSSQGARRLGLDVQLAMNHWRLAVETHNSNFPDTHHDVADLRIVHPGRYWSTNILLASPECTNHSIAKGAKRRRGQLSLLEDEQVDPSAVRSRATMWNVPEYAEHHNYDIIIVENVVDARHWRPWDGWLTAMRNLGYEHEVVYLNSMFAHMRPLPNPRYGDFAPQSRDRLYVVFWKRGNKKPDLEIRPLAHCPQHGNVEAVQSWKKRPGDPFWRWGRYGAQYVYRCPHCGQEITPYYYAAANAIDWCLPAERIGDRARPLKERTLQRIQRGLEMFAGQHLVVDLAYTHGHNNRSVPLFRASLPTQTTASTAALLMLPFTVETLFTDGERLPRPVDEALATQTTRQSTAVVTPPFLTSVNYYDDIVRGVDGALPTQTTSEKLAVTLPPFLTINYSPGYSKAVDEALATVTAQDHHGLVIPPFLLGYANQEGPAKGVDEPLRTFHTENGQALVMPFIASLHGTTNGMALPKGVDDPLATFAAGGNHHGLVVPFTLSYYGANGNERPVDREMGTVTTTDRHALVQPGQEIRVEDCGFRMLEPGEIGRGMAFDNEYIVLGNKREQVRQYGNAVTPIAEELLLERCVATLL